jgi:hypothetical protein
LEFRPSFGGRTQVAYAQLAGAKKGSLAVDTSEFWSIIKIE